MRTKQALSPALIACVWLVGCARAPSEMSYSRDVRPILTAYCLECHLPGNSQHPPGKGYAQNTFSMENYNELMKGTKFGPVIKPGDATGSTLVRTVEGKVDPRIRMPHGKGPLPEKDATIIHNWVAQGAKNN